MSEFPWTEQQWDTEMRQCVAAYWTARGGQAIKQAQAGVSDTGTRGEVTGGQHLDAFCELLVKVIASAGFKAPYVRVRTGVELPGYYRPCKKWDIVVAREGALCAAIEMKSQVGPSFGNNFNNRTEEAVGSSADFWLAFREGRLGPRSPWLGYFFFLEAAAGSTRPVGITSPAFPADPVFADTSYAQRYEILCRRMVLERNYSAATLVLSPRANTGDYTETAADLRFLDFARGLYGHLIGCS